MPRTVHLLALLAAFSSAGATILIRQGLRGGGPYTGLWINLIVGTVGLWAAVLGTGGLGHPSARGIAFFVLAGLVGTVGGRLLRFISIDKVGASIAAALTNLNPLVSAALAILLLGEQVTPPVLVGTVVIVAGTILLSAGGQRLGVRPAHLALPLLSALCFGVVAILRKLGLSQMGAIAGTAVNALTALVAFTAFLLASGRRDVMVCRGRSLAYFVAAGFAENAGRLPERRGARPRHGERRGAAVRRHADLRPLPVADLPARHRGPERPHRAGNPHDRVRDLPHHRALRSLTGRAGGDAPP